MTSIQPDGPTFPQSRAGGRPRMTGRFGSLDAFWCLIEPILACLQPKRCCEIGVEKGIFTSRLLTWGEINGCAYLGIDPAATAEAVALIQARSVRQDATPVGQLLAGRSLDILPGLEACGAYFLDGDHNHCTVFNELEVIARSSLPLRVKGGGPVIFMHDVGWPFGRRDMYHDPDGIPAEMRHDYSSTLGIPFDGDALVDGGFRSVGQYAIATQGGGPRNGVLTAVEDFLAGETGQGWRFINVPVGYGLGILYRPDDGSLPPACCTHLDRLRAAIEFTGGFLESCEANFLTMYLYSEHTRYGFEQQSHLLEEERGAHFETLKAYQGLESAMEQEQTAHRCTLEAYQDLEKATKIGQAVHERTLAAYEDLKGAMKRGQEVHEGTLEAYQILERDYRSLSAHAESGGLAYGQLQVAYDDLSKEYQSLLTHCHDLQRYVDQLAGTEAVAPNPSRDHQAASEMAATTNGGSNSLPIATR